MANEDILSLSTSIQGMANRVESIRLLGNESGSEQTGESNWNLLRRYSISKFLYEWICVDRRDRGYVHDVLYMS